MEDTIRQLNAYLRGELAAMDTYDKTIEKVDDARLKDRLSENLRSHRERAELLRERIRTLGGQPDEKAGARGAVGVAAQTVAGAFSEKAAISTLEESEDRGLKDYREDLDKLDEDSRRLVESRLRPAQEETHRSMSDLKHQMA